MDHGKKLRSLVGPESSCREMNSRNIFPRQKWFSRVTYPILVWTNTPRDIIRIDVPKETYLGILVVQYS